MYLSHGNFLKIWTRSIHGRFVKCQLPICLWKPKYVFTCKLQWGGGGEGEVEIELKSGMQCSWRFMYTVPCYVHTLSMTEIAHTHTHHICTPLSCCGPHKCPCQFLTVLQTYRRGWAVGSTTYRYLYSIITERPSVSGIIISWGNIKIIGQVHLLK